MFTIESTNDYLYHYTSREVGLENILGEMKIRFSPYSKTNDPKEIYGPNFNWLLPPEIMNEVSREEIRESESYYRKQVYEYPKLLCFSQDLPHYFDQNRRERTISRGFSRARLWATCADNHRGMCFVFDKKALTDTVFKHIDKRNVLLSNVNYSTLDKHAEAYRVNFSDVKKLGIKKSFKKNLKNIVNTVFFHKTNDWDDEEEYRIVILNNSDEYIYISINDCLRGIIVGSEFNKVYNPILFELHDIGIKIGRISWDNGKPYVHETKPSKMWFKS